MKCTARYGETLTEILGATLALMLCAVAVTACSAPGDGAGSDGPDDVAGSAPAPERWSVTPTPTLQIDGGLDGFGQIAGVLRLVDGTIAVGDTHQRHVRFFAADGAEEATAGRHGQGPGEFESIDVMWRVGPDTAAVWDARLVRYSLIAPSGEVARTVTLHPTGERARPRPLGFSPDGELVVVNDERMMPEDERYRPSLSLMRYDAEGRPGEVFATARGPEMWNWVWEMGVTPSLVPFGRPTLTWLDGETVLIGTNDGFVIERVDLTGGVAGLIERQVDPTALPGALIEEYRAAERAKATSSSVSKGGNDIFGMMAEDAPYPETLPFYDAMLTDETGLLWVRSYMVDAAAPSEWTVFQRDGAVLATLELPAGFRPTVIAAGRLLGVWRDALDVESVRELELVGR